MKYVLDPLLFAFEDNYSKEELELYLQELINLNDWRESHREEIYILSTMGDYLFSNGYYPYKDCLKPLLQRFGIDDVYSYMDIGRIVDRFMNHSQFIDENCDLYELSEIRYLETLQFDISHRSVWMRGAFDKVLWFVYCQGIISGENLENTVVFTKGISKKVNMSFSYSALQERFGSISVTEMSGQSSINCKASLRDFIQDSDTPSILWKYCESRDDLDLGLRILLYQECHKSALREAYDDFNFVVQRSFYNDYTENHYNEQISVINSALESMQKVVRNIRNGKEHNLRVGPGGNDPYVFHEDYAAMRKNVTRSIRLHYWRNLPSFRFANIGEHNFFDIPWEDD